METPCLPHGLFAKDFETVYEPAEDTFVLLDAIEKDLHLYKQNPSITCLECGSGSGTVITALSKSLDSKSNLMIATDINIDACNTSMKCAKYHQQDQIQVVRTNMAECLIDRLESSVDILIFNPPYVPTDEDEAASRWMSSGGDINLSWAGGRSGRKLIDVFLNNYVPRLLSKPHGAAYMVAVDKNNVIDLADCLVASHSIKGNVVIQRRAGTESLYVIKYLRIEADSKPS